MQLQCIERRNDISKKYSYFTFFGLYVVHFTKWEGRLISSCFWLVFFVFVFLLVSWNKGIIQREETSMEKEIAGQHRGYFSLADIMYFAKKGCETVAEDEVTQRFTSEELLSWNLLSRTNANFHRVSWQLTTVWIIGILIRYCLLVPFRWAKGNLLGLCFWIASNRRYDVMCYWLVQKWERMWRDFAFQVATKDLRRGKKKAQDMFLMFCIFC